MPEKTASRGSAPAGEGEGGRVRIDPRIRRRRIEVRRDEGRRRLRLVMAALALLVLVAAGWGLTRSPLLRVGHVDVVGAQHTAAAAAVAVSGLRPGMAMTDVDEGTTAARVSGLPWVYSASIHRLWPRGVTIEITERRPAASVRSRAGGWLLVDASGRVLEQVGSPLPARPAVEGIVSTASPGGQLEAGAAGPLAVAAAIPEERVDRLPVVNALPDATLELRLNGKGSSGGIVRLGSADQLGEKLLAMFTVLDRMNISNIAVLDVRAPGAPVLTRRSA